MPGRILFSSTEFDEEKPLLLRWCSNQAGRYLDVRPEVRSAAEASITGGVDTLEEMVYPYKQAAPRNHIEEVDLQCLIGLREAEGPELRVLVMVKVWHDRTIDMVNRVSSREVHNAVNPNVRKRLQQVI